MAGLGGRELRPVVVRPGPGRDLGVVAVGVVDLDGGVGAPRRRQPKLGLVLLVAGHADRLVEELDRLGVGAERDRPIGGALQGDPGLAGEGVGLGALGRVLVGGEVVAGEGAGELVRAERLEEAGRGEVAGLAVALGEHPVGDLADQRLDEGVLAALGRCAGRCRR